MKGKALENNDYKQILSQKKSHIILRMLIILINIFNNKFILLLSIQY